MEALGELAGGVAHDFNNLLTGILACAAEVREEAPPGSPAQEAARTIEQAARRAAELTRQLLGFARRGKLCSAPVDLHAAVPEVTRLLGRTLDARISIVTRLEAPRAIVLGDSGQIQHAILNLAVNARDAMHGGGVLTLATALVEKTAADLGAHPGARAGPHVALSVSDTGEGVPAEIVHRIFDPFFTTKEPGRGTGLGLATVYGIAVNHGGFVEVVNEPAGGARFTLFLPLHEGVAAVRPAEAVAPACGGRVLLVDDEALVRAGAGRALARLGCEVAACDCGEAAVRHLAANRVDLAIVDLGMPGLDGLQTFRALRAVDPGLPVVIASGYGRDGRAQEVLDAGALAFLQKPWTLEQLATAVTAALAARRAA
jgi:CheY-like chemotaxis protein